MLDVAEKLKKVGLVDKDLDLDYRILDKVFEKRLQTNVPANDQDIYDLLTQKQIEVYGDDYPFEFKNAEEGSEVGVKIALREKVYDGLWHSGYYWRPEMTVDK